jgi:hypothetical protein
LVTPLVNPHEIGATLAGTSSLTADVTIPPFEMRAEATVLPANWPAERDRALRRIEEMLPLLERLLPVAAEVEAAYRDRAGIGGNRPPELIEPPLEVATVRLAIDAANVFRAELSAPQPRFDVIRVCNGAFKAAIKLIVIGLRLLAEGFVRRVGAQIADEVLPVLQPIAHELIGQAETWLRALGL